MASSITQVLAARVPNDCAERVVAQARADETTVSQTLAQVITERFGFATTADNREDTPARIRELGRESPRHPDALSGSLLLVDGQHEAEQHHRISSHKLRGGGLPVREGSDGLV